MSEAITSLPVVKERPILFSGPMVRALLDGRKTQTRRVVKKAPHEEQDWSAVMVHGEACFVQRANVGTPNETCHFMYGEEGDRPSIRCPYGVPGERLWVRETWQVARESLDWETGSEYDVFSWDDFYGPAQDWLRGDARGGIKSRVFYAADGEDRNPSAFYGAIGLKGKVLERPAIPWRPSIHMPRWASRLTLEITKVRVERLQDISETDAIAEGPGFVGKVTGEVCESVASHRLGRGPRWKNARDWYADLWEEINGPTAWQDNPWVWALSFRVIQSESPNV